MLFSLLFPPGPLASVIGMLVGGGSLWLIGEAYYRYAGQEGMGGGDVKMLAMIGAFLGWKLVLVTLVFSSIAGARHRAAGDCLAAGRPADTRCRTGRSSRSPALVASLYGDRIVAWYVGFYVV